MKTFGLIVILLSMATAFFFLGAKYELDNAPEAVTIEDTKALDECVKLGETAATTLDKCIGRQNTFIQILDDQSEIINSMCNIIWDLPIEDLAALRKEPKPKKLHKFGDTTKSVEEILKEPAIMTVPPPVILPGTNPPVGELY